MRVTIYTTMSLFLRRMGRGLLGGQRWLLQLESMGLQGGRAEHIPASQCPVMLGYIVILLHAFSLFCKHFIEVRTITDIFVFTSRIITLFTSVLTKAVEHS